MASRIKLKLPSFSVTKRSTSGRVSHHFVPRGCDSVLNPDNSGSLNPDDSDSVELTRGLPAEHLPESLTTLHEVTQKELWSHGIRLDGICFKLQLNPKHYRKTNLVVFVLFSQ